MNRKLKILFTTVLTWMLCNMCIVSLAESVTRPKETLLEKDSWLCGHHGYWIDDDDDVTYTYKDASGAIHTTTATEDAIAEFGNDESHFVVGCCDKIRATEREKKEAWVLAHEAAYVRSIYRWASWRYGNTKRTLVGKRSIKSRRKL